MKTVFVNCSLKESFSASANFTVFAYLFCKGEKYHFALKNHNWDQDIKQISEGDNLVLVMPVYADLMPSAVMAFTEMLEEHFKTNQIHTNIYVISNGGYIDNQCSRFTFDVFNHFCKRNHQCFCGGLGIGGGVMVNIVLIVFVAQILLYGILMLIQVLNIYNFGALLSPLPFILSVIFYNLIGLDCYASIIYMARQIGNGEQNDNMYCVLNFPKVLFSAIGNIFFIIISIFGGGFFSKRFYRH